MPIQRLQRLTSLYNHIKRLPQSKASILQRIITNIQYLHAPHRQQLINTLPTQRQIIMIHNKDLQLRYIVESFNILYPILRAIDNL